MSRVGEYLRSFGLEFLSFADLLRSELKSYSVIPFPEKLFTILLSVYLVFLHHFMKRFVIISVPSPFFFKEIYITEILLAMLFLVFSYAKFSKWRKKAHPKISLKKFWPGIAICLLVLFSIIRLFTDNPPSLENGLRNFCFSYYLLFSLMIAYFLSESSRRVLTVFFLSFLFLDVMTILFSIILNSYDVHFNGKALAINIRPTSLSYGLLLPIYFSFQKSSSRIINIVRYISIFTMSLLLAFFITNLMNRTLMLGIIFAFILTAIFSISSSQYYFRIILIYAILIIFSVFILFPSMYFKNLPSETNKINIASKLDHTGVTIQGMEAFRWTMWKDAWTKFLRHPILGIGLGEQVVHRIYVGYRVYTPGIGYDNSNYGEGSEKGLYTPNTSEGLHRLEGASPPYNPISGPHNSFLNILTRFGIFYFAIYTILIIVALLFLHRENRIVFFLLFGSCVYSMFNVSLEGPVHGMWFFIFLGIGLGYYDHNQKTKQLFLNKKTKD